jgi:hypothetical protein
LRPLEGNSAISSVNVGPIFGRGRKGEEVENDVAMTQLGTFNKLMKPTTK